MVEFSQFKCLSSPAAVKLAKQLVVSAKLCRANKWPSRALRKMKKHFLDRARASLGRTGTRNGDATATIVKLTTVNNKHMLIYTMREV